MIMNPDLIAIILLTLSGGLGAGTLGFWIFHKFKLGGFQKIANDILHKAESEAETIRKANDFTLKQTQLEQQRELEQFWQNERRKIQREEERLKQREDKLESRMILVEKKLSDIEKREAVLHDR